MTTLEKLEELKAKVKSYAILGHESAWNDAQEWRRQAKYAIETIFEGIKDAEDIVKQLDGLFNPLPCCAVGDSLIIGASDEDIKYHFLQDVKFAVGLMLKCEQLYANLSHRFKG